MSIIKTLVLIPEIGRFLSACELKDTRGTFVWENINFTIQQIGYRINTIHKTGKVLNAQTIANYIFTHIKKLIKNIG